MLVDGVVVSARVSEDIAQACEKIRKQTQKMNQKGECAELDLLVERTMWPLYLSSMKRARLVAYIVALMGELELMLWATKGA
jgi:hypothetical protein